MKTTLLMYGGFHDKDKLILLSEKMQVCISQIKCNDCAVGVMHLLWWLATFLTKEEKTLILRKTTTNAASWDIITRARFKRALVGAI